MQAQLMKKRGLNPSLTDLMALELETEDNLETLYQMITPIPGMSQLKSVRSLRHLLASEHNPPIAQAIEMGFTQKLISLIPISVGEETEEALWCITNLVAGSSEMTRKVVTPDLMATLISHLLHSNQRTANQAALALGNIAGDSIALRDQVIAADVVSNLKVRLSSAASLVEEFYKDLIWLFSNLLRGNPKPSIELSLDFLSFMPAFLGSEYSSVHENALWGLSYISDNNAAVISRILGGTYLKQILNCLRSTEIMVQTAGLRVVGNILASTTDHAQILIEAGVVDLLYPFLQQRRKIFRVEALWAFSNIAAGTLDQVHHIITHPCFKTIVSQVREPDFEIKREAVWTISNIIEKGEHSHLQYIVDNHGLYNFVSLLDIKDNATLQCVLKSIHHLLEFGQSQAGKHDGVNRFVVEFDELGGIDNLEKLQDHPNELIYNMCVQICGDFFGLEDEAENFIDNIPVGGFKLV